MIVAVIWGQLDVLAAAFMLQAILFNRNGKTWMGVMFAAIGAAIKVFPALIIPYMLLFSKNRIRDLSAILPPSCCDLADIPVNGRNIQFSF